MSKTTLNEEDCPTVWFAALESALRQQDFEKAARAKAQLERLGVEVRFRSLLPSLSGKGAGK